ncbi:MAG: TonB-dependent receptor [Verrucomicrobiales bacterium]|nr:TonB-dependent receptor [Verrucomicrobiales bacterium]
MKFVFVPVLFLTFGVSFSTYSQETSGNPSLSEAVASDLEATVVTSTSQVPTRLSPEVAETFRGPVINDDAVVVFEPETLVSTASRVTTTNFEIPYVVDTITSADLVDRSVRSLPEAFERTPGVLVQKTAHGQGSPFIRGFTAYHNLLLIDGIRLNNSVFRSGPNQYWNTVDSQGLRRIELVKSQGSVLYGSNAVGGTVQALTKRPVYAEEGGYSGGRTYSRYAHGEDSFVQRGEYTVSEAGKYGFILGGTYKNFGDIRAAEIGRLPFTGYEEWDFDAKLEWFLREDLRLTLFHQQVTIDDAWRVHKTRFAIPFAGSAVGNEQARILDQRRKLTYVQLEGDSEGPLFDQFTVSLSHQQQEEDRFRRRANGRFEEQGFTVDTYGAWAQFDKYLEFTDLSYGFSYYHDEISSFRNDYNANGTLRAVRIQGPVGDDASYDLVGAFVQSRTPIGDRVTLDVGTRFTHASTQIGRVQDPATGNPISIENEWQNLSSSARMTYQLDDNDEYRFFLGASQAFRAPNLSDLSRLDSNRSTEIETPAPNLDPEHFVTYEIGVKAETDSFSGSLSYFYTQVSDMILRTPTGRVVGGLNEVTKLNSGDGHVQGVELQGDWRVDDQWSIFGGFAYQDSHVSTFPTSAPILQDEVLSRLLPLNGFGGVRWENPDDTCWVELTLTVFDRADRLNTRDSRDTQRIPPGGTPGYWLAALRSGVQLNEKTYLTVGVENLFDEAYRAHGSGQNEPGVNGYAGVEITY